MAKKKKETGLESVKLKTEVVGKVRDYKKKEGVAIGTFFEKAAIKELDRIKDKES